MAFRDSPWCGLRDAQMSVHHHAQVQDIGSTVVSEWTLLACPRCAAAVVLEVSGVNEPPRVLQTIPEPGAEARVAHLPDDVERYYTTAITVLEAGVPDAAVVQLRRTLEAAVAHHGIAERNLVRSIQILMEQGLITPGFTVLNHIRSIGNIGAHATDEHIDDAAARRALMFTTQVLRNLFEIPEELNRLDRSDRPLSRGRRPGGGRPLRAPSRTRRSLRLGGRMVV